jgi:hypothetical protein
MINRWMAVVLGAMVLAVPGTALAKGDHGKGHGKQKAESNQKAHKHGSKKAKKPKSYVFKGVYKGDGVVTVTSGNSRVRKGGYVGQDVTFDLTTAKVVAAESDGVAGVTAADVKAGDLVLVQARLPRGSKAPEPTTEEPAPTATESTDDPVSEEAPAAIKARKLVVLSRPSAEDDEPEAEDDEPESEQD